MVFLTSLAGIAVNWRRVAVIAVIAAAVALPFAIYFWGRSAGYADRDAEFAKSEQESLERYLKRVGELNADITAITARHADELKRAKARAKSVPITIQERTDANPATPGTDCRVDDAAFGMLVDAFEETRR